MCGPHDLGRHLCPQGHVITVRPEFWLWPQLRWVQASRVGSGVIATDRMVSPIGVGEVTLMQRPSGLDLAWGMDRDSHVCYQNGEMKRDKK